MNHQTDDFKQIIKRQAETRRQQDLDDYNNEISGIDVGRIGRFLSSEARTRLIEQRTGKTSRLTALDMMLLNDRHYAKIYTRTMNELQRAELATERALDKALPKSIQLRVKLSETLSKAPTLSNGTKAFKDINGSVWSEDDMKLDEAQAESIEWDGTEPSYETYLDQRHELEAVEQDIHDIREYQTDVLGTIRGDLTDQDDPKSVDDIETNSSKMKKLMPKAVQQEMPSTEIKVEPTKTADITLPTLD